jgi:hypothetical protein
MALQYIKTNIGIEQDVIITYKNLICRFEIKFNSFFNNWFIDIFNDTTGDPIIYGVKLILGKDCFHGLGLNMGELYLIDTVNDGSAYNIKTDFGDRLKVGRVYAN